MKLAGRSLLILLVLYGMVFALGDLYLARHGAPLWVAAAFAVVIVALQYGLSPSLITWLMKIEWDDSGTELPARNREFLQRICHERGLKMPRIGIIPSNTPNAFTYGHTPGDARVVVTAGLLKILTPEESNAVLAHEIGHIDHWDFVVMTLAALAPLLLYQLYVFTRSNNRSRALAVGAYVCYWVSQFVVFLLSRTREYYADQFSARITGSPDTLASALVKIAYGMVQAAGAFGEAMASAKGKEKARLERSRSLAGGLALMGISNLRSGQSLALSGADAAGAAAVMRWDLVNPWARFYELSSTHPLTALRVRALGREAQAMGQAFSYPLPADQRIRWTEFPVEFLLWAAPWVTGLTLVAAVAVPRWFHVSGAGLDSAVAPVLLALTGAFWMLRTWYRYGGEFQPATIAKLMEDTGVSEMGPRAVRLEGEILGQGVPGAFWSPDLVLRDSTGILFVLYRQSIPFARLLFAIHGAPGYIGQKVTIDGWFRRGLRPYVEMLRLTGEDGKTRRTYSRSIQIGVGALAAVIGLLWFVGTL